MEEDFVEMRKNNPESVTADDLHKMLLVARWVWCSCHHSGLPSKLQLEPALGLQLNCARQPDTVKGRGDS